MAKRKQRKHVTQRNKIIARILIILGLLLLLLGIATHTEIYYRYLITQSEKPVVQTSLSIPREISIPSVKIDVKVDQGGIVNGDWVLSNTDALYLPTSGTLGEGYNTIIYAHNTANLFGKLRLLKTGDLINIRDGHGKIYAYAVSSKENVNPHDLAKLYSTQKNIITLFTCSGWADTSRILIHAQLVNSKK